MAQIGYGYGSEYQLMRFLGHHRNLLEERISKVLKENGMFHWLDFEFEDPMISISGDKELKGLSFLYKLQLPSNQISKVIDKYHEYKINDIDKWQNWDAIFTLNNTIYLVEAKAHTSELSSVNDEHGGESKEIILKFLKDQLGEKSKYQFPVDRLWLRKYYQFANRLATVALLNAYNIKTKALYIYFINGFNKRSLEGQKIFKVYDCNTSQKQFEKAIEKEKKALSILDNNSLDLLLTDPVFIKADSFEYDD